MKDRKLGAFLGVYTPTILGVILYVRLGWVVGHMGLGRTLLIVGHIKPRLLFPREGHERTIHV